MTTRLDSLLESGISAQRSGDAAKAIAFYESALALVPGDAEVLSLLGLALTQLDRLDEAEPLLREAVAREPAEPGFRMNLVELLKRKDLLAEADSELNSILTRIPQFSPAWVALGEITLRQGDKTRAQACYSKAFTIDPGNFSCGLILAELHISLQEYEQALHVLGAIAGQQKQHPVLLKLTSFALLAKQDWSQLESAASAWVSVASRDPEAWQMLSRALMEQGRFRLAEENFCKVLAHRPENVMDLAVYGQICLQCFEYDKARTALQRAETLQGAPPEVFVSLGLLCTYMGEFDKAKAYCQRALQLDPACAAAYTQLGHLNRGRFSDTEMDQLAELQSLPSLSVEQRMDLGFTLGNARETRQMYASALQAYEAANKLGLEEARRLGLSYDSRQRDARTEAIKALFTTDRTGPRLDEAQPCPIFIVGMPRSGTTLVESTISAHSAVFAGGERPLFPQIHDAALAFARQHGPRLPPRDTLKAWATAYLGDRPDIGRALYFTDKNPLNFEALGLVAVLFPNAPIIHIRRNPVETCFSIYKHRFSRFWTFAHCAEDIAHFYGHYARLLAHWEQTLTGRMLTVQYEEFASNFDNMAPQVIRHCGLEWESHCLDFQQDSHAIATLSAVQVRDPVCARKGLVTSYPSVQTALMAGLEAAGVDPMTGTLRSA